MSESLADFNARVERYGRLHHAKRIADFEAAIANGEYLDHFDTSLLKQSREIMANPIFMSWSPISRIHELDEDDREYLKELDEWSSNTGTK